MKLFKWLREKLDRIILDDLKWAKKYLSSKDYYFMFETSDVERREDLRIREAQLIDRCEDMVRGYRRWEKYGQQRGKECYFK